MTDNDGYIGCIYKLVNLINGKVYIGQTRQTLNKRRNSHFRNTCNKHLRSALNKYGKQNFTILTLESIYEKDVYYNLFDDILNIKERYWINYYNSLNPLFGYNKSIRTSLYEDSKKKKQQYKKRGIFCRCCLP